LCTAEHNSTNCIKPPWNFHSNFSTLRISHVPIHQKPYKSESSWRWLIENPETTIRTVKFKFVRETGVVFYMVIYWARIKVVTNFFDTYFIILKALFCVWYFIVWFLEEVERKGKEQWCSYPENSYEYKVSMLIFAISADFFNTLPEGDNLLSDSALISNWWWGVFRKALFRLFDR